MTRSRTTGDLDLSASRRALFAGALGVGGAGVLAGPAQAAPGDPVPPQDPVGSYYLTVAGIQGESTADRHPGAIDLLTWSFGATTTVRAGGGGGGASAGRPVPADFVFVSRVSKASPKLYLAACNGKHLPSVKLEVVRRGEGEQPLTTVLLDQVMVHSYQVAPGEQDGYPIEVGRMTYDRLTFTQYFQHPDGSQEPVTAGWDFRKNKPV